MTNSIRSLDDLSIAYLADDSWVWKDDMIVFARDDGFYDDARDRMIEMLHDMANDNSEHPICSEFPQP